MKYKQIHGKEEIRRYILKGTMKKNKEFNFICKRELK
jgi:hypothetical protein